MILNAFYTAQSHLLFTNNGDVVAQDINNTNPLINVPYVEVEEEDVEQLAKQFIADEWFDSDEPVKFGIKVGYEEAFKVVSAKKWSDEDMLNAYSEACNYHTTDFGHKDYEEFKASLQPKIKSIEIEMITVDNSEWNDKHTVCYRESDIEQPITYTKNGKTFLKVKKKNYE